MREEDKTTVIDIPGNPKNAALYFDYVIPYSRIIAERHYCGEIPINQLKPIFPPQFQKSEEYTKFWDTLNHTGELWKEANEREPEPIKSIKPFEKVLGISLTHWHYIKSKFPPHTLALLLSSAANDFCTESYDCTSLTLAQIPLIDTSRAEWVQIIEIRKDENSINRLRKLKTFFHKNYSGKEKNYVQDDLLNRIEEYNNAVKDWGFETVTSSLTVLFSSKEIIPAVTATLAMLLFGQPVEALVIGGTGLGLEIGKMSLHIAKEKRKLSKLQRDHPLAYIIDAKKKLEGI